MHQICAYVTDYVETPAVRGSSQTAWAFYKPPDCPMSFLLCVVLTSLVCVIEACTVLNYSYVQESRGIFPVLLKASGERDRVPAI